jgi:uncharacterized protein
MRTLVFLALLMVSAAPVLADEASRQSLAREFVHDTRGGLPESIMDALWQPYEAQIRAYNPGITDDVVASLKDVLVKGFAVMADQINDQYAELYATQLSEDELTQLVDFFHSPLGKRYLEVNSSVGDAVAPKVQQLMATMLVQLQKELNDAARDHGLKLAA